MISTIKMKNCATYPTEGAVIENCRKVNFFYGPNGSGKSTISNFLYDPTRLQYRECEIEWENDAAVDVVVYNREFRTRNVILPMMNYLSKLYRFFDQNQYYLANAKRTLCAEDHSSMLASAFSYRLCCSLAFW